MMWMFSSRLQSDTDVPAAWDAVCSWSSSPRRRVWVKSYDFVFDIYVQIKFKSETWETISGR